MCTRVVRHDLLTITVPERQTACPRQLTSYPALVQQQALTQPTATHHRYGIDDESPDETTPRPQRSPAAST
jgi:hypothetical protein